MEHDTYMKTFEASHIILQAMNSAVLRQHPEVVKELQQVYEIVKEVRFAEPVKEVRI